MSKYSSRRPQTPVVQRGVHPVMRGIGCIMMIIVPILAYITSDLLTKSGFGSQIIPVDWYGYMKFPPLLMKLSGLAVVFGYLSSVQRLPANLLITVIIVVIVGGIMTMVYGYIYTLFGPSKYGPTDAPPPRVKVKRYKR